MGGVQRLALQIAQRLQAIALEVDLALADGHVAQLGPGLDVEHEEQAVDQAQALEAEFARVQRIGAGVDALLAAAGLLVQLARGLVAQDLDGLAQRVLEVFADAEGVAVGVLVQGLQQAGAGARGQAFAVQQRSGSLQGGAVLAVEDLGPVEAQRAVVGPLVAVQQQPVGRPGQDEVARGRIGAEHGVTDQVNPARLGQRVGHGQAAVVQRIEGLVERGLVFQAVAGGVEGGDDHQVRGLRG